MSKAKKVVAYVRVSSSRLDYTRQLKDIQSYCEREGRTIERIFEEKASGGSMDREQYKECVEYIKENGIKELIISTLDRLGRTSLDMQVSIKELHDLGCSINILSMNLKTLENGKETMAGKIVIAVFSQIAEVERENIKQRLQGGYKHFRSKGGKVGRKVGYTKDIRLTKNYKQIRRLLEKGNKLVDIQLASGVSLNTIRKVRSHLVTEGII